MAKMGFEEFFSQQASLYLIDKEIVKFEVQKQNINLLKKKDNPIEEFVNNMEEKGT